MSVGFTPSIRSSERADISDTCGKISHKALIRWIIGEIFAGGGDPEPRFGDRDSPSRASELFTQSCSPL
jgi:hypothetical protein